MVHEIWSTTDIICCQSACTVVCPFTPLWYGPRKSKFSKKMGKKMWRYYHFTNINNSHMMYGFSDMECSGQKFFVLLDCFLLFYPTNNPKNENFGKMKKLHGDIIILRRCNISDNHMMYGSWDMKHDGQNCFVILDDFLPFYPLTTQRIIISKKLKKMPGDMIILHKCTINDNHMTYDSWDMKHDGQNFLSFWTAFCPFTPITKWKIKMMKNVKKKHLEVSSFYTNITKIMIICCTIP